MYRVALLLLLLSANAHARRQTDLVEYVTKMLCSDNPNFNKKCKGQGRWYLAGDNNFRTLTLSSDVPKLASEATEQSLRSMKSALLDEISDRYLFKILGSNALSAEPCLKPTAENSEVELVNLNDVKLSKTEFRRSVDAASGSVAAALKENERLDSEVKARIEADFRRALTTSIAEELTSSAAFVRVYAKGDVPSNGEAKWAACSGSSMVWDINGLVLINPEFNKKVRSETKIESTVKAALDASGASAVVEASVAAAASREFVRETTESFSATATGSLPTFFPYRYYPASVP